MICTIMKTFWILRVSLYAKCVYFKLNVDYYKYVFIENTFYFCMSDDIHSQGNTPIEKGWDPWVFCISCKLYTFYQCPQELKWNFIIFNILSVFTFDVHSPKKSRNDKKHITITFLYNIQQGRKHNHKCLFILVHVTLIKIKTLIYFGCMWVFQKEEFW